MGLQRYREKRDFKRTAEPPGTGAQPRESFQKEFDFVVQKHDATRLHYDFRLEMDGVLKSWAVPKGIPTRRGERHLAVEVEDHPLEYGSFEGTIAKGNYGAGTVMLWDRGFYMVSGDQPSESHRKGKLHLWLRGKKLKGEWTLVRIRHPREEDKPQWLLFKTGEDAPDIQARVEDRSVLTGRSMNRIAQETTREWKSDRPARRSRTDRLTRSADSEPKVPPGKTRARSVASKRLNDLVDLSKLPPATPGFVEPMKATMGQRLPKGQQWLYEIKFDGVRALAIKDGNRVELFSRAQNSLTQKYLSIAKAVEALPVNQAVIDGEVVVLDETGRSSFQLLQVYQQPGGHSLPLLFYAFDIIQLEGRDLTGLPLVARKAILERILPEEKSFLRSSAGIDASTEAVVSAMKARGLEGLLAKLKDSKYQAGRRNPAWVKYKWSLEQEFAIGGYTSPKGTRTCFGALLVGYYQGGRLICAGKVGTGFDERGLKALHRQFQAITRETCPFANLPVRPGSGAGLTRRQMRECTWLEPKLVCQVRFAEWTRDGLLRQPSFLGLRDDKEPKDVIRETGSASGGSGS